MPELPEVETIKKGLEEKIIGLLIKDVTWDTSKMLAPDPQTLLEKVRGAKVVKIGRRAKMPLIYLDNRKILAIHLKLNGQLLFRKTTDPADRFVHVIFHFDQDCQLRFADQRKFGWVKLLDNEAALTKLTAGLGPEPFSDQFNPDYFRGQLKRTLRAVKIVLMDQQKFAGIGNIYATEALFYAGINPEKTGANLTDPEVKRLYQKVLWVLRQGLKYQGATDRDFAYRQVTGEPGNFQEHFAVYGREGEPCLICRTQLGKIKLGGRGTYFCPRCQK